MSDPVLDALAESARNRGLKLVRSRVRTPGKRRFGKAGLTDASGKPVFGMDARGPAAKPEEVEEYLRGLGASDWGASLDGAEPPPRRNAKASPAPRPKHQAKPKPRPAPPKPELREARPADARRLVELVKILGHEIDEAAMRRNLAALRKAGEPALVATLGKAVVGLCGMHRTLMPQRDTPPGRITILVVAEEARGHGIGRMLVEAAEEWMRSRGCTLLEITSNDRLAEAHAFYRHMGYERTSIRFCKTL